MVEIRGEKDADPLVVGERPFSIVHACGQVDAVIDNVVTVDTPHSLKPIPLPLRPVSVEFLIIVRHAVCQMSSHREKQFIGNSSNLRLVLVPPDSSVARSRPATSHVFKNLPGGIKIFGFTCEVKSGNPGQRPPGLVIVEGVEPAVVVGASGGVRDLFEGGG